MLGSSAGSATAWYMSIGGQRELTCAYHHVCSTFSHPVKRDIPPRSTGLPKVHSRRLGDSGCQDARDGIRQKASHLYKAGLGSGGDREPRQSSFGARQRLSRCSTLR